MCSLRKSTGDDRFYAPLERESTGILHRVWIGCWHILGARFYVLVDLAFESNRHIRTDPLRPDDSSA